MVIIYSQNKKPSQYKMRRGLVNNLLNKLSVELHLSGYEFCGPGTNIQKRIARGDKGINLLDAACREHYIPYHQKI